MKPVSSRAFGHKTERVVTSLDLYLDSDTLSALLREVAAGVRSGAISLGAEDSPTVVKLGDEIVFELRLTENEGQVILVDLSWRREEPSDQVGLVITS